MTGEELIASIEQLEEFGRHEAEGAIMSPALTGILAEVATKGVNRYPWRSLRPLVSQLLEQVICQYESEEMSGGPLAPLPGGESPEMVVRRFRLLLLQMPGAPWTLQRLAELLLAPGRQYTRLHKLVLALEKLLLVSGECPVTQDPPPRPRLADLRPVNVGTGSSAAAGGGAEEPPLKRQRTGEADPGAGLLAAALEVRGAGPPAAEGTVPMGDGGGSTPPTAAAAAGGEGDPAAMEVEIGPSTNPVHAAADGPGAAGAGVGGSPPPQAANGPLQEHHVHLAQEQQQQQQGGSSRGPGRPPDAAAPPEGSRAPGGSGDDMDAMDGVEASVVAAAAAAAQQTVPL